MRMLRDQEIAARAASMPGAAPEPQAGSSPGESAARAVKLGVIALVLLAPVALAWGGWAWLSGTPGFAVRRVVVSGCQRVSPEEIAALSGALGTNAFALDLGRVRAALLAHPWVADATVRRALPHELRVSVTERVPVAVEVAKEARRVIDESGAILGEGGAEDLRLPELRGISSAPEPQRAERRALAAATLTALRAAAPALHARAEALDVSDVRKLVLRAQDCPPIWLSGPASADEAAAWSRREIGIGQVIGRAAWVDARWRDRLYVMPAAAAAGLTPSTPEELP